MQSSDKTDYTDIDTTALAKAMGVTVAHLSWLARSANDRYYTFEKPKANGSVRYLKDPSAQLRQAQTWLLANVLDRIDPSDFAKAFNKGDTTLGAVSPHAGNLTVLRIDFDDFYGHIKGSNVHSVFTNCGLGNAPSWVATDICCLDGTLPQGGITSPRISNLFMKGFDERVAALCQQWQAVYTRYADDCLFSFSASMGKSTAERFIHDVTVIAEFYGQAINENKTRVMVGPQRKTALGLTIGDKVTMFRAARKNFRALCWKIDNSNPLLETPEEYRQYHRDVLHARGMYAYMKMVDPYNAKKFAERFVWLDA